MGVAAKDSPYASSRHQLVSMFGRQPASHRATAPYAKFGTGTRDQAMNIFISKEHSKSSPVIGNPGPVYDPKSSLGTQVSSFNTTLPTWRFGSVNRSRLGIRMTGIHTTDPELIPGMNVPGPGSYQQYNGFGRQPDSGVASNPIFSFDKSTRDQAGKVYQSKETADSFAGRNVPGAGTYDTYSMNGKQADAAKPSAPNAAFTKANRFKDPHTERAKLLPAPGDYVMPSGQGRQVLSRTQSNPKYGFGTTERDQRDKMFISKEHEKAVLGREGPGPCGPASTAKSGLGKQVDSMASTLPSYGFGKQGRFGAKNTNSEGPGPGAYNA
eukprot:CAMPEP_0181363378 /NCGR_PEP_ID=MMETSP1106-20121128/8678_1 /TAXON_ID=81844 /ORGANISM="Mantoniella antarctica, Strain SL-175" /LENGTH=324 /DNA_ID=CAMNT_0023477735 /DNA_START=42 /DNA_END=1016 /DNA_ORIENTATION=-